MKTKEEQAAHYKAAFDRGFEACMGRGMVWNTDFHTTERLRGFMLRHGSGGFRTGYNAALKLLIAAKESGGG